jgi:hypothetical protein
LACDFFSQKVVTAFGVVEFFVLFFVHVGSRRVHIAGMSTNPDATWVAQQARNVAMFFDEQSTKPTYLLRDNDSKFGAAFDTVFEAKGITVKKVGPRAPNMNAYAERWVQSVRRECLDHFVVFGEGHLRHILKEYETHYNLERCHPGVGNVPLTPEPPPPEDGHHRVPCTSGWTAEALLSKSRVASTARNVAASASAGRTADRIRGNSTIRKSHLSPLREAAICVPRFLYMTRQTRLS